MLSLRAWVVTIVVAAATGTTAGGSRLAEARPANTPTVPSPAPATAVPDRPAAPALRLSESAVLGRFTAEVRKSAKLRQQALALWRSHFEAEAGELERSLATAADWRPVLARAADLVEDFLEASLLPREGIVEPAGDGQGWVEILDPASGQRVRKKVPLAPSRPIFAPANANKAEDRKLKDAGQRAAGEEVPRLSRPLGAPVDTARVVPATR